MSNDYMRMAKQYEKHKNVQNVMSYINKESLMEEHIKQQRGKATGIDGVGKAKNAINNKIADIKNRTERLDGMQRYGQKRIETRLEDGSILKQSNSQLSGNMRNIQTINRCAGKVYYVSMLASADGKISYSENIVDSKEAGKTFTKKETEKINGRELTYTSYEEKDIRIPNTGKKIVYTNSIEGSDALAPEEIEDGNPQLSYETSVIEGKDGIESVAKCENGKCLQSLSKKRNGQIAIMALDKESGGCVYDTYLPTDGEILLDGFDNINSAEIPDLYIDSFSLDGGYNPFTR